MSYNIKTENGWEKVAGNAPIKDNYSTEEQVIGTWIDGKPLYRKVFDVGNFTNGSEINYKDVTLDIENIDKIFIDKIFASDGTVTVACPYVDNTTTGYMNIFMVNKNTARVACGSNRSSFKGTLILNYTKTTD